VREILAGNGQPEVTLQAVNCRGRKISTRIELALLDGRASVRGAILMMHPQEEEAA
jgi:hypothetical protein